MFYVRKKIYWKFKLCFMQYEYIYNRRICIHVRSITISYQYYATYEFVKLEDILFFKWYIIRENHKYKGLLIIVFKLS